MDDWISKAEVLRMLDENGVVFRAEVEKMPTLNLYSNSLNDLISRAAACECIGKMIHEYREKGEYALADGMIFARRYGIKSLPAVDAALVVRGEDGR